MRPMWETGHRCGGSGHHPGGSGQVSFKIKNKYFRNKIFACDVNVFHSWGQNLSLYQNVILEVPNLSIQIFLVLQQTFEFIDRAERVGMAVPG